MGLSLDVTRERQGVIDEALSWLGTPYRYDAGMHPPEKGVGIDCRQLAMIAYRSVGIPMPAFSEVPRHDSWIEAVKAHSDESHAIAYLYPYVNVVAEPQRGDTALFQYFKAYIHTAVVIDWPTIVHAVRTVSLADASQFFAKRAVKFLSPKRWS